MVRTSLALSLLALLAPVAGAQTEPADALAIADAAAPSLVQVEFALKPDRSEEPTPMSGRWASWGSAASVLIRQERPLELGGYLVGPTRVVVADMMFHPRFVTSIHVRYGETRVPARVAAYAVRENAMFLELDAPLPGAAPLTFHGDAAGPYFKVGYTRWEWTWTIKVDPLGERASVWVNDTGEREVGLGADALITDAKGRPVALNLTGELHLEREWRGSPLDWEQVAVADWVAKEAELQAACAGGLLRVALNFRSPRNDTNAYMEQRFYPGGQLTEWSGLGILVAPETVLVLANLDRATTARLKRISVFVPGEDQPREATFAGSLARHGALLARLPQALPGPLKLATGDVRSLRDSLLLMADVLVQGETRVEWFGRGWFTSLSRGKRDALHPDVPSASAQRQTSSYDGQGPQGGVFLFTLDGALLSLPLAVREPLATRERWGDMGTLATPAADLARVLADVEAHLDPHLRPLSEEEANQVAWLGVELQPLDRELARASGVAHLTNDGTTGAVVALVYPGSPAEAAGLRADDLLLRLHVPGQPKPIEVRPQDPSMMMGGEFPWDRLDEIPEEYFDQIPAPWPNAESALAQTLTELGFGTRYTAEVARQGELLSLDLQVVQGPTHYRNAPRFTSAALGLTVADLTYEVRRYLQLGQDAPGVVVSKVEQGQRASVSGIKPFELVTHVDDQPVNSAEAFGKLAAKQGELRLSVKRMHRGRIVRIRGE